MGKNKLQKFADITEFANVFQYPFSVLREKGFDMKGKWGERFFGNDNPIVLELGCGKGEYTVGLARNNKDKNFIGIDIKGARIWSGAKEALETGLANAAFLRTSIELLPYFFDAGEVSEIWITFPDPQMKKVRKRLTSTSFMERYSKLLKTGGIIHLKTDSPFLFKYTSEMVRCNGFKLLAETDDLYNSAYSGAITEIRTFYEQQWLDRGFKIKYISFVFEPRDGYVEPDIDIEFDEYRSFNRSRRGGQMKNTDNNDNLS